MVNGGPNNFYGSSGENSFHCTDTSVVSGQNYISLKFRNDDSNVLNSAIYIQATQDHDEESAAGSKFLFNAFSNTDDPTEDLDHNSAQTYNLLTIDPNATAGTLNVKGSISGSGNLDIDGNVSVDGVLTATRKSFLIPHPTDEDKQLQYASLEGPENGVYIRGKLKGDDIIELPHYWTELIDKDSITVSLTPIGNFQYLYVRDISTKQIMVGINDKPTRRIYCHYVVYAERKDIDKLEVEI